MSSGHLLTRRQRPTSSVSAADVLAVVGVAAEVVDSLEACCAAGGSSEPHPAVESARPTSARQSPVFIGSGTDGRRVYRTARVPRRMADIASLDHAVSEPD